MNAGTIFTFFLHRALSTQNKTDLFSQVSGNFMAPRVGFEPTTLRLTGLLTWGNVLSVLSKPLLECVRPVASPLRLVTESPGCRSFQRGFSGHIVGHVSTANGCGKLVGRPAK